MLAAALLFGSADAGAQQPASAGDGDVDRAIERLRTEAERVGALPLDSLAPEAARDLREALAEAGRRRGDADPSDFREALGRARRAIHRIVEAAVLGPARRDSAGARRADAHELAPRSWREASALLDRAEGRLRRGVEAALGAGSDERSDDVGVLAAARGEAGAVADSAALAYRFAWRLAFLVDSVRDRAPVLEAYVLERDSMVALTVRAAGATPSPRDGPADDLAAVREELARRADSGAVLRERVSRLEAGLRDARGRADSLRSVLDSVGGRLEEVSADLDRRLRRESRVREVKALFSGEEGSVLATDDSVVIRLTGLTFPPGEADLPEDAGPLLVKLRSAIQSFPGARVRVEGHTDARGDAERNRVLSQRRAIAVREHLLLNLPISADRITAVGRGEVEPVASNDSEEGRARNRRIQVVLRP